MPIEHVDFGSGAAAGAAILYLASLLKEAIKSSNWGRNGSDRRTEPPCNLCSEHPGLVEKVHRIDKTVVCVKKDVGFIVTKMGGQPEPFDEDSDT